MSNENQTALRAHVWSGLANRRIAALVEFFAECQVSAKVRACVEFLPLPAALRRLACRPAPAIHQVGPRPQKVDIEQARNGPASAGPTCNDRKSRVCGVFARRA